MTLEGQSLIGMFYDSAGRERERRQGNGLINRYHYDELGQLASHQIYRGFDVELNDTPLPVWQQQYQYEPDGQLAQINGNQARHYRYDKLGQLQTVSYPQANREEHHAEKVELFSYDTTGNKISEKQSLAQLEAKVNRGNRLLFFSDKHFEYDRFGNLIAEKRGKNQSLVTHYEYDCRHRLIKVIKPSGQTITYSYDPFNRRTSKTVNGKTTEFIWQGHKLIAETDNDKHWQSYLYEQDSFRPLALVQGNAQQGKTQLYWYQNDQLGTPIGLTDGFGETLYECQYNGYGQIIDETYHEVGNRAIPDNPLRFQGQYYDEETGLHYNLNRYYDPFVGRYITQDPIKLIGGLNFYQYCQNPVNWIDPLGFKNIPGCGTGKVKTPSNTANARVPENVPMTQEKFDEIINLERGNRPPVHDYLSDEYIKAHRALFETEGGSFIVIEKPIVDNEIIWPNLPPKKFVGLRSDMEKIVEEYRAAGNDWRVLNERLALGEKNLAGARIYIVHIKPNDIRFKFGMSTGNEFGAYKGQWIPGGFTKGGIPEAVLEGSEVIKTDGTIETIIKQFENFERLQ